MDGAHHDKYSCHEDTEKKKEKRKEKIVSKVCISVFKKRTGDQKYRLLLIKKKKEFLVLPSHQTPCVCERRERERREREEEREEREREEEERRRGRKKREKER